MSTMLTEPESATEAPAVNNSATPLRDASALVDRMPDWFRTSKRSTLAVLILALLFLLFSRRLLWHTDLWGHLAYGRAIWNSGRIPAAEPLMPLAEGMPLVDTAWLSQLIGYGAISAFGVTALQFLYAAAITACLALLLWRIVRKTGSLAAGVVGLGAFLWVEWQVLGIIRPQLAGLCCFVALLTLLTSRRRRRFEWIAVAALMALWANLHGSFPAGLAMLGAFFIGRAIDVYRRTGTLRAVWCDGNVRRLLVLLEVAAAAVLINPYGLQLYAEVWRMPSNPNLADLVEWGPLTLRMKQGQAAFAVALALIVLLRFTPRRITTAEWLLLVGFGAAALWSSRFLVWWAPAAAMALAVHGHAVLTCRLRTARKCEGFGLPGECDVATAPATDRLKTGHQPRRSLWTVASLGLCWIAFASSPFGMSAVHGIEPELSDVVSTETPVHAAEYLREHPPRGQVFNPYEWGDYLAWAGPQPPNVFVTSHAHLVPRDVWRHYILILTAASGWDDLLARYGVESVVINLHLADQRELLGLLRKSPNWQPVFQDERSVIFARNQR